MSIETVFPSTLSVSIGTLAIGMVIFLFVNFLKSGSQEESEL